MPKPKRTLPQRRVKGQAKRTAMVLFGVAPRHLMETPAQREQIALVLRNSTDERMRTLAAQASDPMYKQTSFAVLAEKNKLNYYMVAEEFKHIMRGEGYIRQAQHLPDLMEQAAIEARSKFELCDTCDGKGTVPDADAYDALCKKADEKKQRWPHYAPRKQCTQCKGKGKIWVKGDVEQLKMIFETYGLIGKGGAGLNVNFDLRRAPEVPETMSDLAATLGPILEGEVK